jgi:hypothetical protein
MVFSSAVNAGVNVGQSAFGPLLHATDPLRLASARNLGKRGQLIDQELGLAGLRREGLQLQLDAANNANSLHGLQVESLSAQISRMQAETDAVKSREARDVEFDKNFFGMLRDEKADAIDGIGPMEQHMQAFQAEQRRNMLAGAPPIGSAGPASGRPPIGQQLQPEGPDAFTRPPDQPRVASSGLPPRIAAIQDNVLRGIQGRELREARNTLIMDDAIPLLRERLGRDTVNALTDDMKFDVATQLLEEDFEFRDLVEGRMARDRKVLGLRTLGVSDLFRNVGEFFTESFGGHNPSFEELFGSPLDNFQPAGPELSRDL